MAMGIYDDSTRHQVYSFNNRRAFKTPSVEKFALFLQLTILMRWRVVIGLVFCSRQRVECSPYFMLTLRVWLPSHSLASTSKLSRVSFTFMCALLQTSRFLPYAHASTRGELLFDGRLGLGLGVGAPYLGGGHPSLTPTLTQVWTSHHCVELLNHGDCALFSWSLVLGFQPSYFV